VKNKEARKRGQRVELPTETRKSRPKRRAGTPLTACPSLARLRKSVVTENEERRRRDGRISEISLCGNRNATHSEPREENVCLKGKIRAETMASGSEKLPIGKKGERGT